MSTGGCEGGNRVLNRSMRFTVIFVIPVQVTNLPAAKVRSKTSMPKLEILRPGDPSCGKSPAGVTAKELVVFADLSTLRVHYGLCFKPNR